MSDGGMTWASETTSEERTLAMCAHLLALLFPVIGPLFIWLLKKETSRYTGYHALQATIFQAIAWFIGSATCGVGLVLLILPIVWAMKANNGEWVGYPLIDGIGRDNK